MLIANVHLSLDFDGLFFLAEESIEQAAGESGDRFPALYLCQAQVLMLMTQSQSSFLQGLSPLGCIPVVQVIAARICFTKILLAVPVKEWPLQAFVEIRAWNSKKKAPSRTQYA